MPLNTGLVQVAWRADTGLKEDACVNTWHYSSADVATDAGAFVARLDDFYRAASGGVHVNDYFSSLLTGTADVKVYDLDDPMPRVPVYGATIVGGTAGTTLPSECAVCLSFSADVAAGDNAARRRGRVYIGPLAQAAQVSTTDDHVASALVTVLCARATVLAGLNGAIKWVTFSRADQVAYEVTHGFVDNAFDTQRRRGQVASSRTLWT